MHSSFICIKPTSLHFSNPENHPGESGADYQLDVGTFFRAFWTFSSSGNFDFLRSNGEAYLAIIFFREQINRISAQP